MKIIAGASLAAGVAGGSIAAASTPPERQSGLSGGLLLGSIGAGVGIKAVNGWNTPIRQWFVHADESISSGLANRLPHAVRLGIGAAAVGTIGAWLGAAAVRHGNG